MIGKISWWWESYKLRLQVRKDMTTMLEVHTEPMRALAKQRYDEIRHRFKVTNNAVNEHGRRLNDLEERLQKLGSGK